MGAARPFQKCLKCGECRIARLTWCSIANSFSSGPVRLLPRAVSVWLSPTSTRSWRRRTPTPHWTGPPCAASSGWPPAGPTWVGCFSRRTRRRSGGRSRATGAVSTHNPVHYLHERGPALEADVLRAAGAYLRARPSDIALTDSTTMGLGLLYNGLELRAGDEVLTTTHDFFATHEALRLKAARSGASVRRVTLYRNAVRATQDEIVSSLIRGVGPRTRVIALTWVHSSTGVKLPIRRIARALGERRPDVLVCVDGVHGVGVENETVSSLGCDFLIAGCHKWLFGPRGTGFVWGRTTAWDTVDATIPSFSGTASPGAEMTPGGFHSFEHRWALAEAFRLHMRFGKARVERRIHALNRRLKAGLASMSHVT